MPKRGWNITLLLFTIFFTCEHAKEPTASENGEATFSAIQQNILRNSCALSGCHQGSAAPFGLDLSEGQAYGNLVNVRSAERPSLLRVNPGAPDSSYMVKKIEGAPDIEGQRMPLGREPLSDEQIAGIREWIKNGAKNN